MPRRCGIRFTHEYADFATRVHGTRYPPFGAIEDVMVGTVLGDGGAYVGGVGRCHGWLGHREARPNFPVEERFQPALSLVGSAVFDQYFHVTCG